MNLLPIVISLLLLLSALAYSQMASILQRAAIRQEYACYIQTFTPLTQNLMQKKAYEDHHIKKDKDPDDPYTQAPGRAKINIGFFTTVQSEQTMYDGQRNVLYRLIQNLYGHRTFFQDALKERPDAVEAVINAVIAALKEGQITFNGSVDKLSTLRIEDPFLAVLWQKMAEKIDLPGAAQEACKSSSSKPPKHEPYILDFLFLKKEANYPYRIWLAEKPLLEAIFINPQVVQNIIERRNAYYKVLKGVRKDERGNEAQTIKDQLETEFGNLAPNLTQLNLDFTASLAKPP